MFFYNDCKFQNKKTLLSEMISDIFIFGRVKNYYFLNV